MKLMLGLFLLTSLSAGAQTFTYQSGISAADKAILQNELGDILSTLPQKFKSGLPASVKINLSSFGDKTSEIPSDLCDAEPEQKTATKRSFTYGKYQKLDRSLTLNSALVREFSRGKNSSTKISCQHGSLFEQARATIIHELGHAFDMNNGSPSQKGDFANIAGFKNSKIHTFRINDDPMRSPDEYEFKNTEEAFAINLEYFVMDEEFSCRRPVMFSYYKKLLGTDPFPSKNCQVNRTLMLTSQLGMLPVTVDPERVYRIDYLMAAPGRDMSSGFGHSMYRIVMCAPDYIDPVTAKTIAGTPMGEKCLKDKLFHSVVSYRANNQDATLNYFKGIFGGYPSQLFLLSFADVLEEYNRTELRDVTAYPMKFTRPQIVDFLNRVSEEHWGYRGSYKFVTNNCATESLRIIKNTVAESRNEQGIAPRLLPTLTPVGLRHLLTTSGLIDQNDPAIETYKARTDYLIAAYSLAYGYQKKKVKADNEALSNFVLNSKFETRKDAFVKTLALSSSSAHDQASLLGQKNLMTKLASFSILEQQIIRVKAGMLKKKLAEMATDKKMQAAHPELALLKKTETSRVSIDALSSRGYGIPLSSELATQNEVVKNVEETRSMIEESQKILEAILPQDTKEIRELADHLNEMNVKALDLRRVFKSSLDQYIESAIRSLKQSRPELLSSGIAEIRKALGSDLVTVKEIADDKIVKLWETL